MTLEQMRAAGIPMVRFYATDRGHVRREELTPEERRDLAVRIRMHRQINRKLQMAMAARDLQSVIFLTGELFALHPCRSRATSDETGSMI